MSGEVVPFGKYKGQPVEVLRADDDYCQWLMGQDWFRAKFTTIYQTIVNYGAEPQDTPEHNEMQASFLDDGHCIRLAKLLYPKPPYMEIDERKNWHGPAKWVPATADNERSAKLYNDPEVIRRRFEVQGWDVVYGVNWLGDYGGRIRVELKPTLGDDFPTVLRQVKSYSYDERDRRCVVARRASFEKVAWEQVVAMFAASKITLLREAQLTP